MQMLTNLSEIFPQPSPAFSSVMGGGRRLPRESGAFWRFMMKKNIDSCGAEVLIRMLVPPKNSNTHFGGFAAFGVHPSGFLLPPACALRAGKPNTLKRGHQTQGSSKMRIAAQKRACYLSPSAHKCVISSVQELLWRLRLHARPAAFRKAETFFGGSPVTCGCNSSSH